MFYRYVLSLTIVLVLSFSPFNLAGLSPVEKAYAANPGDALWARSTVVAPYTSTFYGMTTDVVGNVYAVGSISGNGEYNFGNGVTVSGNNTSNNVVIVKYNPFGEVQWAKSTVVAPDGSTFDGVVSDAVGNVYAVGMIYDNGEYNFGNGVTVAGNSTGGNTVIVKYNSSGEAQWARSTVVAPAYSYFQGVTTDSAGSIYAVGDISGTSEYNFGNGVTVTGNYAGYYMNAVIVKYNSSGEAQWARSTVVAPSGSEFFSATTDYTGNVYAVGYIRGTGEYNFGNGVTVAGNNTSNNVVIVKYNSAGDAQWAKSTVVAPNASFFYGATTDSEGNIYTVGFIRTNNEYNFGNSITVSGGHMGTYNAVVVKYNSAGEAQWAKSTVVAPGGSIFRGVITDTTGNVYTVGYIGGDGEYSFGNGVIVSGNCTINNTVIVKYNSAGEAQWAKSTVVAPHASNFYGLTTDSAGSIYAAGYINGTNEYSFGNSATVAGNYGNYNAVVVKYAGLNTDIVYQDLPSNTVPINIEDGEVVTTPLFTIRVKPYSAVGISKVEFYVDDNLLCTSHTSDKDGVYSCKWDTTKYQSTIKIIAYNTLGERETIVRTASVVLPSTTASKETTAELTVLPKTGR